MSKKNLGKKRVCPSTGKIFYDLNKDPIVSPYTGEILNENNIQDSKKDELEIIEDNKINPIDETEDQDDNIEENEGIVIPEIDEESIPDLENSSDDEIISYAGELNGAYPNRLRYGTGVYNSNADNVGSAVGRQGPDVMATRLWFAKQ